MSSDMVSVTAMLRGATPMVDTLGIEVLELDTDHAVLRLPNLSTTQNHVGGPHAGAIFTAGESAAAALMVARFGHLIARDVEPAVGLAVKGEIAWSNLVTTDVLLTATSTSHTDEVEAEFLNGGKPQWTTDIVFRRSNDDAECARMSVVLTLVRPRPPTAS